MNTLPPKSTMASRPGKINGVPPSHSLLLEFPSRMKLLPRGVEPLAMKPSSKVVEEVGEETLDTTGALVAVTPGSKVMSW